MLPTASRVSSRFPWDPFPAPVTSSGEDICSPTEHLPLTLGRNQAFPGVYIIYLRLDALHTHRALLYTILNCQLLSRPSTGTRLAAHRNQIVGEPLILTWSHFLSSHIIPYIKQHISIYASNAPCELRRNVLMDQTIVCDARSTFCRLLNISLARLSVGSPAHYRMLITSHQVTWNCWTALSYVRFHGKHQKAKPLHSWLRKD